MTTDSESGPQGLHQLAATKLVRVFGEAKGEALMTQLVAQLPFDRIETVEQLEAFTAALEALGPMESAAASMIRMAAALRLVRRS